MADRHQDRGRSYEDWDPDYYNERLDREQNRGRYSGAGFGRNLEDDYTQDLGRGDYGSRYGANYGGGRYSGREQGWGRRDIGRNYDDNSDNPYGSGYSYNRFSVSDDYDRYEGARNDDERYRTASRGYRNRDEDRDDDGRDPNLWDRTRDKVSSWFRDDDDRERGYISSDRGSLVGGHRGKGPKGYRRSEERIREDVCERLSYDHRIDASNIDVEIQGDEVILTGSVQDKDQKRRAEDLIESITGVRNVENRIRVDRAGDRSMRDYTGNTDEAGAIGRESGTTNEVIRDTRSERGRNK